MESVVSLYPQLTGEQRDCLTRCSNGLTLRFERSELVDPLIDNGYAERGLAGVVTVTARGQEYLKRYGSKV